MDRRLRELERRAQTEGLTPQVVQDLFRHHERLGSYEYDTPQLFVGSRLVMSSSRAGARIERAEALVAGSSHEAVVEAMARMILADADYYHWGAPANRDLVRELLDAGAVSAALDHAEMTGVVPWHHRLTFATVRTAEQVLNAP